jgi:hypothetical protein
MNLKDHFERMRRQEQCPPNYARHCCGAGSSLGRAAFFLLILADGFSAAQNSNQHELRGELIDAPSTPNLIGMRPMTNGRFIFVSLTNATAERGALPRTSRTSQLKARYRRAAGTAHVEIGVITA